MNTMTIDERVKEDLNELCNGGNAPGKIQAALALDGLVAAKQGQTSFSTKGLPGYYCGDRGARTVLVMLNPGQDVKDADDGLMERVRFLGMNGVDDIVGFHRGCRDYGHIDQSRPDNFDLKQAFFLHKWSRDSGISFPEGFCPDSVGQTLLDAKENVLTQKLQLELIPYASSSFSSFNKDKLTLVVPYVETLFEELFSQERKYVIFCSRKFERMFQEYNKANPGAVIVNRVHERWKPAGRKVSGSCSKVVINYRGKSMKALIANTFPHQALPNAKALMEDYGEYCYRNY